MPKFAIWCSIEQENISHFRVDDPSTRSWGLILRCTVCQEVTPNFVEIDPKEEQESNGGTANLYLKCKGCKKDMSVNILKASAKELEEQVVLDGKAAPVVVFDCRGCEPESVSPSGKWIAENEEHGKSWKIVWEEGGEEFAEYEEELGGLATISKIEMTIRRG